MGLTASVGRAQALDGREAAIQATHQALDRLGSANVALGMVFAAYEFPIQFVLAGVSSLLSNTPLWGISTTAPMDQNGAYQRTVVVALVAGNEIRTQATWWHNFSAANLVDTQRLLPTQQTSSLSQRTVLLACDGFVNELDQLNTVLVKLRFPIIGCLASGPSLGSKSYLIAGNQSGSNGLATLLLTGSYRLGSGTASGWLSSGHHFKVTSNQKNILRELDGISPAQAYSQILGHTNEEWSSPPLAELVRLYPLGFEQANRSDLVIHSPIRVNPDGSFLMNTQNKEGSTCFMMIGTRPACLKAAQDAVQQALISLHGSQPILAIVFCDVAWQLLFEAQGSPHLDAIRSVLGNQIPLAGGYTFGQITSNFPVNPPEVLNQSIQVILFAA